MIFGRAGRGYCYDDSIPHNYISANGLRPTSGYFIPQIRLLEEYHLFGIILILITWECPRTFSSIGWNTMMKKEATGTMTSGCSLTVRDCIGPTAGPQGCDLRRGVDTHGFYSRSYAGEIFEEGWRPLVVFLKGVRDTEAASPQTLSSDRIGGGGEAEVWGQERAFVSDLIKRGDREGSGSNRKNIHWDREGDHCLLDGDEFD